MTGKVKCDLCGKSFNSRKQIDQHKALVHNGKDKNDVIRSTNKFSKLSRKQITIITTCILVAVISIVGIYFIMLTSPKVSLSSLQTASGSTIDNIPCNTMEQSIFHIHAHLDIFINGQPYVIPPQIGIIPGKCLYWLHTHDNSGIIHIESAERRNFTLGEFFDIWNKKFNNTQLFDNVANETSNNTSLTVFVNGSKVNGDANHRDIRLNDQEEIAIVYGRNPPKIPDKYNFASMQ